MKPQKYYIVEDIHDNQTVDVLRVCTVCIRGKQGTPLRCLKLIWVGFLGHPMVFNRMEVSYHMMRILAETDLLAALSTIAHGASSREVVRLLESLGFIHNPNRT